jgi:hypothetical protein
MTERHPRRSHPVALSTVIGGIFAGTPIGQRLKEARIWTLWDEAVGPTVASKARPVQFRDGILTVAVTSAPWLQQLSFMKRDLVTALNQSCGEEMVRDIFLKAGSGTPKHRVKKPAATYSKPPLPPDLIDEISAEAKDPELARLIARLMALDGTPR